MVRFIKAQASSLVATGVDFMTAVLLVEAAGFWYVTANMTGNLAGGMANFFINRRWVFRKEDGAISWQAVKYVLVWTGNLLLNAGGVWLLGHYTAWPFAAVKVIVAVLIGIGYNYVMQKRFVFK